MKRKKQKRATRAFKIRTAQSDQDRTDLAYWGRVLTPLERWMDEWLANSEWLKRLAPDAPGRENQQTIVNQAQSELQRRLLEAVKNLDAAGLRQLAAHMDEMTQDYRAKPAVAEKRDATRSQLLTMKQIYPQGLPLRTVAAMIGYRGELSTLEDIAKDADFPLQAATIGRPKKGNF
jgi:hypothetical protein